MEINLFQGNLQLDQPVNPCSREGRIYGEIVEPFRENEWMYSVQARIPEFQVTRNLFYLQLSLDNRTCILGPRTSGNMITYFTLREKERSNSTEDIDSPTETTQSTQSPKVDGTTGPNTIGAPKDFVIIFLAVVSALLLVSIVAIAMYRRRQTLSKSMESNIESHSSQISDPGSTARIVVVESDNAIGLSLTREEAAAIGNAYRDALRNHRWSESLSSDSEEDAK
jgi:hypothetical protein